MTTYRPQGVLVCWDEKPTHRLEMHPDYKASRRPMPDLLREQRPHFKPLVEAFGYENFSVEGWEADDVIGTLSRIADEAGVPTCVVSTDRDAFQLVSDNVCLMMTPRGVEDPQVYTPERVVARLGIPPAAVPDYIGLKGDTGDDIKGVPGIGDKTASELLQLYGSIDGIYEHIDEVAGPKRRQSLIELEAPGARVEGPRHHPPQPAGAGRARPGRRGRRHARPLGAQGAAAPLGVPRPDGAHGRARGARAVAAARRDGHRGRLAAGDAGRAPRRARDRADRRPRGRRAARGRGARGRGARGRGHARRARRGARRRPGDRRPRRQGAAARLPARRPAGGVRHASWRRT